MPEEMQEEKKRPGRPPVNKEEAKGETVTIEKDVLSGLLARLDKLENPGVIEKTKRSSSHVSRLAVYEGELVVRVGNVRTDVREKDPDLREQLEIETESVSGKRSTKVVPYKFFMDYAFVPRVNVLWKNEKKERKTKVVDQFSVRGAINTPFTSGEALSDVMTGRMVDAEIEYIAREITVEVMEGDFKGKEYTFTEETINALNA